MITNKEKTPAKCETCQGTRISIDPIIGDYAQARLCHQCFQNACGVCGDLGFQLQQDSEGRETALPCPNCEIPRQRIKLYNQARIPKNYAHSQLSSDEKDQNNSEIYNLFTPIIRMLTEKEQKYIDRKGLVLMGPSGTGKTHLMAGFVYRCTIHHGISCTFQPFDKLLYELRKGYSTGTPEMEIVAPLLASEVLIIDDLGKGRNTAWELNVLDMLITERYNSNKSILVTSNYTENETTTLKERILTKDKNEEDRFITDTLRKRVGERIYSRLQGMCYFKNLIGPDRRLQIKWDVTTDGST